MAESTFQPSAKAVFVLQSTNLVRSDTTAAPPECTAGEAIAAVAVAINNFFSLEIQREQEVILDFLM